jgi:predicted nucleic acid-binding protein
MSRFLLDVNALLALLDPMHIHHGPAHTWYAERESPMLLLCAHVENGVMRVASQPRYPNCLGTSGRVREVLQGFVQAVPHEFCARTVSLLHDDVLVRPGMLAPSRVSDLYLLALAVAHEARLATFDRRIPADAVAGGAEALELISTRGGSDG